MPVNLGDPFGWLEGPGAALGLSRYQGPLTSGRKAGQRLAQEAVQLAESEAGQFTPAGGIKEALLYGRVNAGDRSGRVALGGASGPGSLQVSPAGQNWYAEVNAGADPGFYVGYDTRRTQPRVNPVALADRAVGQALPWSGQPEYSGPSAAQIELESQLENYRSRNPDWHRP